MGTSFVAISVFWAANVSEIVTISVFTTGGWGGREGGGRERGGEGEEKKVSACEPDIVKGDRNAASVLFNTSLPCQFHSGKLLHEGQINQNFLFCDFRQGCVEREVKRNMCNNVHAKALLQTNTTTFTSSKRATTTAARLQTCQ